MRAGIERRAALEQALRYAAGSGELSVVYQPVVDLPTGRVVGAEALLRWTNPEFGAVPPLEFIQIAEETGMIEDLGSWVLSQACQRLVGWDSTGLVPPGFTMAVNVSTRQLRDDALPDRLREVLHETGLAPHRVVLEVTESAMHEDQEAFIRVLHTLRDLGVQISIDDFGTGYSSLSYLSRLPATSVKLDRSLVKDVAVPPGDAIARAVQGIAQALGLTVVAEGVEDDAQRSALSELNIAHAQGYLWGRPMPPKDFIAQLAPPPPPRAKKAVRSARP
jgi:EAL domain-containing protein (putative c-di-GMP-specific phosphodiesterase class I)